MACVLAIDEQMFLKSDRSGDRQVSMAIEYPVYRGSIKHGIQHMVIHSLVGRWRLAEFRRLNSTIGRKMSETY